MVNGQEFLLLPEISSQSSPLLWALIGPLFCVHVKTFSAFFVNTFLFSRVERWPQPYNGFYMQRRERKWFCKTLSSVGLRHKETSPSAQASYKLKLSASSNGGQMRGKKRWGVGGGEKGTDAQVIWSLADFLILRLSLFFVVVLLLWPFLLLWDSLFFSCTL